MVTPATSNIRRKVLVVVLLIAVLCVPLVVLLSPADVSLHLLKLQKVQDAFVVSFAISNETHGPFRAIPMRLERLEGHAWREFSSGLISYTLSDQNVKTPTLTCTVQRVPGRLRVVALHQDAPAGLASFVHRVGMRLRGERWVSLKPFDKSVVIHSAPIEVVSDEFEEP